MKKNVAALVLAAGFSSRFEGDKRFAGKPPLILKTLQSVMPLFQTVFVIHRAKDPALQSLLAPLPVSLIAASSEDISLGTSIKDGIKHILHDTKITHCALFLADMPFIKSSTIEKLLNEANNNIVRPKHNKTPGHPVIFAQRFFYELSQLTHSSGAKTVIDAHQDNLVYIPTKDPGVTQDIDYQKDLLFNSHDT